MTLHDRERDGLGRKIGGALGGALDRAVGSVGTIGRLLGTALPTSNLSDPRATIPPSAPGAAAGIEHVADVLLPPAPGRVRLRCIDFSESRFEDTEYEDVDAALDRQRPEWSTVRWINVQGLHPYVVNRLREELGFHTLAAEDVYNVPQRPKAQSYENYVFVVVRMFQLREGSLDAQQISGFAAPDMLVTFQEDQQDLWAQLRSRMRAPNSPLRRLDASYLLYSVLDTVVDHCFLILELYGERLGHLEDTVLTDAEAQVLHDVHAVKRDLTAMRRVLWSIREAIAELGKTEHVMVSATARTYLRDVHDHCIQIIDIIETFRDLATSLTDLHVSMTSHRMTEAMQVLAVISTIFIPITFLAGVYGMNFSFFPELHWRYSYAMFWVVCFVISGGLLWYFRRRGWLGRW
jgi:magnesium transporter